MLFSLLTLCRAATPRRQLPYMVQEDRPLQRVQLRGVRSDLGQERIRHQHGSLLGVTGVRIAQQCRNIHLQRACETVKRGQRRHRLAILDLRDISARNAHAGGELALAQIADVAQIAHRSRHLNAFFFLARHRDESQSRRYRRGLFDLEGSLAASAGEGWGAELHELAVVAAKNFPLSLGLA